MKPMVLIIAAAMALAALVSPVSPAYAEPYGSGWYGEIQAVYERDDNISRTYKRDKVSDNVAYISIGGGYSRKHGDRAQLILSAYLAQSKHDEYDALDSMALSLGADYTFQLNTDYNVSWYKIKLQATHFKFKDSDPREGVQLEADLSFNKRLTLAATGRIGYRIKDYVFVGKSGAEEANDAAFDTSSQEIYLGADYQFRTQATFFAEYVFRHGDILSTVAGLVPWWRRNYDARTPDRAFEKPCTAPCVASYAYRTRGNTNLVTLGFGFPFRKVNIDVTASHYKSKGDNSETYKDTFYKVGLLWNF
ncbi:MAG: hypothetical protein HN900_00475 [Gammaproteobacteria bacterium]|nr:hypothetical protein [Gammaproteobacteria bacterium]